MDSAAEFAPRVRWSRHQIDAYNTILPALSVAMLRRWTVAWVTLTSAVEGSDKLLWRHHSKLQKWLRARAGVQTHWCGIRTNEGHGVLHLFWIFEGVVLLRAVCESEALKDEWQRIHGARQVVIKHVGGYGDDALRLSRYSVGQYAAGQEGFMEFRRSRQFFGVRDPKRVFAACKRAGRYMEWPTSWNFTSPMARDAAVQVMMNGEWTYKGKRHIWTENSLVIDE